MIACYCSEALRILADPASFLIKADPDAGYALGIIDKSRVILLQLRHNDQPDVVDLLINACVREFNAPAIYGLVGRDNVEWQTFYQQRYNARIIEDWEPFPIVSDRTCDEWVFMCANFTKV